MKKSASRLMLLNAFAGYAETAYIVWCVLPTLSFRGGWAIFNIFVLVVVVALCGGINLLLWGIYALEQKYAKNHAIKKWDVPAACVTIGVVLNIILLSVACPLLLLALCRML